MRAENFSPLDYFVLNLLLKSNNCILKAENKVAKGRKIFGFSATYLKNQEVFCKSIL